MSTERTRAALQAWMAAQASRDSDQMTPLVAENAKVVWPVGAPVPGYEGRDEIVEAFATGRTPKAIGIDASTFSATPGRIVVDGNTAVVELSVTAATVDGSSYENDYAFFYQFDDDGLLVEMREYGDTLQAARQLPAAYAQSIAELTELNR